PRRGYAGAYGCLRGIPSRARLLGKSLCECPAFHARALETIAWGAVANALMNRDTLDAGLQAGREQHDRAQAEWATTRKAIDKKLASQRKIIRELVVSQASAKRSSPTWQALAQAIQQADAAITQLEQERVAGAPRVLPGLSPDQ